MGPISSLYTCFQPWTLCVFRDITTAINHAFALKIYHRDIKPSNVIVHNGHGYLIDWGIATSGGYLINLTNDHNLTKYYGPEWLQRRVTPVHIFFGGGQGEVELRYLIRLQSRAADCQSFSTLCDSGYISGPLPVYVVTKFRIYIYMYL